MKKLLEKIITISLAIVSLFFVIILIVIMSGKLTSADMNNSLVKALIALFSIFFLVLTSINIYTSFADRDKLADLLLFKGRGSATKASLSVVKKTCRRVCKGMEDVKIRKITLHVDENANVTMNIDVKVISNDTLGVITKVRALITETLDEIFGVEFAAINFVVKNSKNTFVPSEQNVQAKIDELKQTIKFNKPEPTVPVTTSIQGDNIDGEIVITQEKAEATEETVTIEEATVAEETPADSDEIAETAEESEEEISEEATEKENQDETTV